MHLKRSSAKWRPFCLGLNVLSWEWRCSWSSADRRCSNYIWVINNSIANIGAAYIRGLTVKWNRDEQDAHFFVDGITGMPTVLYIQNAFCIWHIKSVFCMVILEICILLVLKICILQVFSCIQFQIYIASIIKKLNQNVVCLCNMMFLLILSIIISIDFIHEKCSFSQNNFYGWCSVFHNLNLYFFE